MGLGWAAGLFLFCRRDPTNISFGRFVSDELPKDCEDCDVVEWEEAFVGSDSSEDSLARADLFDFCPVWVVKLLLG